MVKVLENIQENLYVYIYTNDHVPAHVHIFVGTKKSRSQANIKINIGDENNPPELVLVHPSVKNTDIKKAWELVANNQNFLLNQWLRIHGKAE